MESATILMPLKWHSAFHQNPIFPKDQIMKKYQHYFFQKFNLIETYDYDERLTCLHDNWGRLFVGLSDGVVSVRSLKVWYNIG